MVRVTTLLLADLLLGLVALLVVGVVAVLYRGRQIPRAERLTDKVDRAAPTGSTPARRRRTVS